MTTVSPAPLSPVVSPSHVKNTAETTANAPEHAFGHVLAREIGRQDEGASTQSATEKSDTPTAETTKETAEETAKAQQTSASPWLFMLQTATIPAPIQPILDPIKGDTTQASSDQDLQILSAQSIQLSGGILPANVAKTSLTSTTSDPAKAIAITSKSITTDPDSTMSLSVLMASPTAETGKNLPPAETTATLFTNIPTTQFDETGDKSPQQGIQNTPMQILAQISDHVIIKNDINIPQRAINEPVGNARWGDAVAQQVSLMLGKNEQQLEMQLTPPHLGPMEVRLTIGGEQASVIFTSQNAGVREALSVAIPRLTTLLADQGIQLTNVQVASDSLNQQAQDQARQQNTFNNRSDGRKESSAFELENPVVQRVLTSINMTAARSGVSLYV